ncbi:hypothetical protein HAX54_012230 [Datura stramonium]|uniref:Uncharacterized protein n=1 Tax=Datura stramonium TaxID=4076 RepID=A0ABS8TL99_DATST|nr:hypothetical protein [Datura stramonium]
MFRQMGLRYKKTIDSENVKTSLHGWRHKVKTRVEGSVVSPETLLRTSLESVEEDEADQIHNISTISGEVFDEATILSVQQVPPQQSCTNEISECHIPLSPRK